MSEVEIKVKHWKSQPVFDREILAKLKLDELEFLCRIYHNRIIKYKYNINKDEDVEIKNDKLRNLKNMQQRYKQLCEEIDIRKCNLLASPTYYMSCTSQFDVYTGNIHNVHNGMVVENIAFTVNEKAYHVTISED